MSYWKRQEGLDRQGSWGMNHIGVIIILIVAYFVMRFLAYVVM